MLDTIIKETQAPITHSIIWLHGLGANGHDFAGIVPQLQLPSQLGVRFVFPHAPPLSVTINNGFMMPAWYDILGLDPSAETDAVGVAQSEQRIQQLIEHEIAQGIPSHRIIVAGFSQGGAMALHTGLRFKQPLAGIIALSCYLPLPQDIPAAAQCSSHNIPILQCHGTLDPVVACAFGQLSCERLQQLGYTVQWHCYPMEHSVCPDELTVISQWLQRRLFEH